MLYTTRDADILTGIGAQIQRVDVLDESAARILLANVSSVALGDDQNTAVSRIVTATGGVALALALVAATVAGGRTWTQAADDLERAGGTFLAHPYADTFKAMQIATAALDDRARAAYTTLAVYPEDTRVPVAAVTRLWAATHATTPEEVHELLVRLAARALLTFDRDAIAFHDLQRQFLLLHVTDMCLMHEELLRAYRRLRRTPGMWRTLPYAEPYIWGHLQYHLQAAGDQLTGQRVVRDLGFLAVRCAQGGHGPPKRSCAPRRSRIPTTRRSRGCCACSHVGGTC